MNSSTSSFRVEIAVFGAVCAGVFALALAASEWLVQTHAAPEDTLTKHVALFKRATSPYVAFGDSHVARGFDAQAPIINLAYPSENIAKMAWKSSRYLEQKTDLKIVLLQADPHLFSPYRVNAGLEDYPDHFAAAAPGGLLALSAYYRPQLIVLWQSFIKNGGRLHSSIEVTEQGALLSPGNLARWSEIEIERFTSQRISLHRPQEGFQNSETAQLYNEMIGGFLTSGARICLVSMPISPIYRSAIENLPQADRAQWRKAEAFFEDLAADPRIYYIDHRALYDDLKLFRDPDHLNKEGAVLYGPVLQDACFKEAQAAPARNMAQLQSG